MTNGKEKNDVEQNFTVTSELVSGEMDEGEELHSYIKKATKR